MKVESLDLLENTGDIFFSAKPLRQLLRLRRTEKEDNLSQ